jgi:hypothetical protein
MIPNIPRSTLARRARAKSRNQTEAIASAVRKIVRSDERTAAVPGAGMGARTRIETSTTSPANAATRDPARIWPVTRVPVEIGVTRYPSWYPYMRSSMTCSPPETIEPMKIARHTTAGARYVR